MAAGLALGDDERRRLLALMIDERDRLAAQVDAMRLTFDELVAAADLEPPDDEHDPDGTTAYERAQVSSLRSPCERSIESIDEAIQRLDQGTYGTCTGCGAAIPLARLEAVLDTDRCVACATGRRHN